MKRKLLPFNKADTALFDNVEYVIEATSYEQYTFWYMNHKHPDSEYYIKSWEEILSGHGVTIGYVDDMPVVVFVNYAKLNGHLVAFYYATSMIVDYNMVREWIEHHTNHIKANGRWAHTDANNFGHCYSTVGVIP